MVNSAQVHSVTTGVVYHINYEQLTIHNLKVSEYLLELILNNRPKYLLFQT